MRKINEVLRLHHEHGLSARQIAKSLSIARSTIKDYIGRAQQAGLIWPLAPELDENSLEHFSFLLCLALLKKNTRCLLWNIFTRN